jgi:hypothetical protein
LVALALARSSRSTGTASPPTGSPSGPTRREVDAAQTTFKKTTSRQFRGDSVLIRAGSAPWRSRGQCFGHAHARRAGQPGDASPGPTRCVSDTKICVKFSCVFPALPASASVRGVVVKGFADAQSSHANPARFRQGAYAGSDWLHDEPQGSIIMNLIDFWVAAVW